jgi:archaetidylinositol phosphate synthase
MLTKLKQRVQQMLTTEARAAHSLGFTPNRISGLGIILALLAALSYLKWQDRPFYLSTAVVLLLASGFCDTLDGVVARVYGQTTEFGGLLDSVLDRYADAAVYVAIIISGLCDAFSGLLALTGSLLVSYSRARAEAANVRMESVGIAERAERIIILVAATLIAIFWQPAEIIEAAVILLAIITNLTVAQRGIYAYEKLKKSRPTET